MRRVEKVQTRFQTLEIWKSNVATEFRVAGAIHASYHRNRYLTGLAWDLIAASCLLMPAGPPRSILMLGLAGGTALRILRRLLPDCGFTAIEIDSEIISMAHRHMDLNSLKVEIVNTDAYPWLEKNRRKFDVVIDDIYLAGKIDVFRPQLMTEELLDHLRLAVAPGGLLATNLVTGAGHRSMQSQTRRCFQKGFPTVRSLRTCDSMNEVLVAGESVATGRRLPDFSKYFPDWRDRMYWDRIKVKSLS